MTEYLLNDPNRPVGLMPVTDPIYDAGARVLTVGADKQFKTISAAVSASRNGDVILVDAGTYTNDFVHSGTKLTVIGVGGMVNMVATVPCLDRKAIWTVGQDLTLENFTFSGATVSAADGGNGAGIRYEGGKLVLKNNSFFNNQNGVMGGEGAAGTIHEIVVDHSLFSNNGSGSGNTHNIYVGAVDKLTVTNSIFEKANVGHELKSRALQNIITDNWFRDGPTGTASYDIDLPNGGASVIENNVIEKGPKAENNSMIHYGGEALPWANSSLLVQGNTFINDKNANVSGVLNQSGIPVTIQDNTFSNVSASLIAKGPATIAGNVDAKGKALADSASTDPVPGSTLVYLDANPHSITLNGATQAVRGGAGHLTVYAQSGHVIAIGGAGGMDFSEGPGSAGNQVTTAAGSTNKLTLNGDVVDSRGNDTITSDSYNTNGTISGNAQISMCTSDQWTIKGTAAITGRGQASPYVTVMSGAKLSVTGQISALHLTSLGGTTTVDAYDAKSDGSRGDHISWSASGGSVSGYIWQGQTHLETTAGGQAATLRLGDGTVEVFSKGRDQIWAGAGNDSLILGGGGAEVHAGTGTLAIYGRSLSKGNEAKVYGNGGNYMFAGDSGNIIYYGGDKASTVDLKVSFMTIVGGAGKMSVHGGSAETIIGGSGGLDYTAGPGGGGKISTAAGSTNTIRLDYVDSVDSWGSDTITGGTSNDTITVHGNASVTGGSGVRTITLMGQDVFTHNGNANVTVAKGADATVTVAGWSHTMVNGGTVRLATVGAQVNSTAIHGTGAEIYSTSSNINVQTTAKGSTDVTVSGKTTVGLNGTDTLHAGAGASTANISVSGATVFAGSGTMNLNAGLGGLSFIGGSGDSTLTIYGGANDIVFGSGKTTVTARGGAGNTFEFVAGKGGGTDIIQAFRVGVDHLKLEGVTATSQAVSGGAANIVLSDNTHLQLAGITNLSKVWA